MPFYHRLDAFYLGEDEWRALVFYRPTECVPADFNLLLLFDVPRVFGCGPQTVEGFGIFTAPGPPVQQRIDGLGAVPIWFLPTAVAETAIADGVVTMPELESLGPLKGTADFYTEVLHVSGVAQVGMWRATARGRLDDGRSFFLAAGDDGGGGEWKTHTQRVPGNDHLDPSRTPSWESAAL